MKKCTNLPEDHEIEAIIPTYTETGDAVRLCLRDGTTKIYRVRMKTILAALAARHAKTLSLLRTSAKAEHGGRQAIPLAIGTSLILLPCKMRRPRIAGDETMGCINVAIAAKIKEENKGEETGGARAILCLATGREIPLLWTVETARRHLCAARLLYFEEAAKQRRAIETDTRWETWK